MTHVSEDGGELHAGTFFETKWSDQTPRLDEQILATRVQPWSAQSLRKLDGVAYLTGDGQSALRVLLFDSEVDSLIRDQVSEFVPVQVPLTGIAYIVPEGPDAGIWFTKAR